MPRLNAVDPDAADDAVKPMLDAVKARLGVVPNVTRTLANSAAALKGYLGFSEGLASGALDRKAREAIALTVAGANSCDYCSAAHSFISKSLKIDDAEIARNLKGETGDAKLQPVLDLARALVDKRGFVSDDDLASARKAGLDDAAITEIVANVVLNTYTNYINHVAETEIDFPKA
jgi:uncharacterized peroxidase-related enzyme